MAILKCYKISSLPFTVDGIDISDYLLGSKLMICSDLGALHTEIITDDDSLCARIKNGMPGFNFEECALPTLSDPEALVVFSADTRPIFSSIWQVLASQDARLYVSLSKAQKAHTEAIKGAVESLLSAKEVRQTLVAGGRGASQSKQTELYYDSGERNMLISLLESLNQIEDSNHMSYKVLLVIDGSKAKLEEYIRSKARVFEKIKLKCIDIAGMHEELGSIDAIPFGYHAVNRFITFADQIARVPQIRAQVPNKQTSGLKIGTFLKDSISESESEMLLESSTLNLGMIITGLPGTGKTFASMSLLSKLHKEKGASTVVISPTKEWADFAKSNGLYLVKIYNSNIPINFFRCENAILRDKFSENLAMLIASASNAGPYQNSMEKCLLAAFRKVYGKDLCPDPTKLYSAIEEEIIEQHGKRTKKGTVKYTKHGENVKAALEGMRHIISRPEFSSVMGIDFAEVFGKGAVFDLSDVSNSMKQFFYALILNQLYAFLDSFDERGDNDLRVEIALEEAQLIFSHMETSPVVVDLKQRIQDFRKRGVGLLLITHSITDVTASIRRLCQTKFYFRQSADVAKYALTDLGIEETQPSLSRLRSLERGCCAVLYLQNRSGEKVPAGPAFVAIENG
ncbi:MAG: ATP-binding protein [Candidatus Micrarchaeota archaeon]|nr:ATP-binding protein [Candidatus Micrarchaeota archaeon]